MRLPADKSLIIVTEEHPTGVFRYYLVKYLLLLQMILDVMYKVRFFKNVWRILYTHGYRFQQSLEEGTLPPGASKLR